VLRSGKDSGSEARLYLQFENALENRRHGRYSAGSTPVTTEDRAREQEAVIEKTAPEDRLSRAVDVFLTPRPTPATPRDEDLLRQGTNLDLSCGLAATAWGDGPTVLLAHGWEGRQTHWYTWIAPLKAAGFRAVAVDAPAHGDSPGTRTNVLEYGQALCRVGREIGPLAGVVAHSFGAGATAIALHRGLAVGRAALIAGPSSLTSVIERWGRHHGLPGRDIPSFVRRIERVVGEPIDGLDVVRIAREQATPALIVHDRGDEEIPVEDALAVAAAWPGAKPLITRRYGHRRILIAGEVVRQTVEFLSAGLP
jgi:pimeloyl-ACP methyl ester carboxylesterase